MAYTEKLLKLIRDEQSRSWHEAVDNILDSKITSIEFASFFLGDFIGSGISRYVFNYKLDPKYVVKIEVGPFNANAMEHRVWEHVQFVEKVNMWFAPCREISSCGRVMLQRKAKPFPDKTNLPKIVPRFFTDLKVSNWGLLNGHPVCFDYASHLLMENGMDLKYRKADWRIDYL